MAMKGTERPRVTNTIIVAARRVRFMIWKGRFCGDMKRGK